MRQRIGNAERRRRHAQRHEDVLLDVGAEFLTADAFDDMPGKRQPVVRVGEHLPGGNTRGGIVRARYCPSGSIIVVSGADKPTYSSSNPAVCVRILASVTGSG
ncbi:MAG: hypothetical protein HC888_19835 [Candidatus Competibacteraceae bacterium]|nr:hypothetical protein [Candidatus Competibacteraceae bacterium]